MQWLWMGTVHDYELAMTCDFQQCGILISVDSDEPVQPPFKLRISKWCAFSSLTLIEYSSDKQRLWSDCAYVQADLRLCWSHIPHCWKSHGSIISTLALLSPDLSSFENTVEPDQLSYDKAICSGSRLFSTLIENTCLQLAFCRLTG